MKTFPAATWQRPTVNEVKTIMELASQRLGCEVRYLHKHFDADARTFRRWKEKADVTPDALSTIKYTAWGLLVLIATGKLIFTEDGQPFEPKNPELWMIIQNFYVFKARDFVVPSVKIVTLFIGQEGSITGLQRQELAHLLGYDKAHFGRLIGNMKFGVWAAILVCFGVPIEQMFDVVKPLSDLTCD
ncbi:hypothetical protein HC723_15780 [Vibrio sp. S11_S32]|uniref:hypothetical protein n=1 Tax=Vibrio sp. S11_S32 TaxID=2720225 RepID=UPI0016803073|nr:hypothetical protein [Vibrio sp. S11_S32]MBD1577857.1 hypothetical protein [Vibrio sp. S11_S32]